MAKEEPQPFKYTKYERARILGARAVQLAMGAPFLIKLSEDDLARLKYNPLEIAKLEMEQDVVPITVIRPLPKTHKPEDDAEQKGDAGDSNKAEA